MLMSPTPARSPLLPSLQALVSISISIVALLGGGGWATIPCSPTVQCPQNCCCGVNGYCGTGDGYCGVGNCLSQCPKTPSPPANPPPQAQAPPAPPSANSPPTSWGSSGSSRYAPPPPQYFYSGGSSGSNIADLEYHDIHHHDHIDNVWRIVGIACGIAALVLIAAFLIFLLARSTRRHKNECDCDGDH